MLDLLSRINITTFCFGIRPPPAFGSIVEGSRYVYLKSSDMQGQSQTVPLLYGHRIIAKASSRGQECLSSAHAIRRVNNALLTTIDYEIELGTNAALYRPGRIRGGNLHCRKLAVEVLMFISLILLTVTLEGNGEILSLMPFLPSAFEFRLIALNYSRSSDLREEGI
ncbi:uncharacterized protein EAE97_011369 [Botrytis byssoidea]|uniref:Uncharacterized protein n=1 Tax=Botrytis byssoidea TaxID=139641 RepID=A0A9P5HUS5_9HELO|nr:uncharacterized protein EAE97_011369 [Botrytis byssoidea]KAF7921101.1 hypothetical protein EAE97_011369 [Botrytis byssoidea]